MLVAMLLTYTVNMAGTWDGFTEDDIKNIANNSGIAGISPTPKKRLRVRPSVDRQGFKYVTRQRNIIEADVNNLSEGALFKKPTKEIKLVPDQPIKTDVLNIIESSFASNNNETPGVTMDDFHTRQKLLEEQNRQRKDFLAKQLSDRKKQTSDEAKRIQQIQDELHKLDTLLSDDVAILRDQIEVASKDFGEAQKRFSKAEKEYQDSKQCLFSKMERKELLTKHLCTIIEQNELRKAHKLSELMEKLAVPSAVEVKPENQEAITEMDKKAAT